MKEIYSELMNVLKEGCPAALCTKLLPDGKSEKWVDRHPETASDEADICRENYLPEERLIILGGGHVSRPLALFGTESGFAVTVVDDRPAFANRQRFPEVRQVLCESFERCFEKLKITSNDYVVVVTRGHRYDMDCLRALLSGTEPAYMGMMGSKRRVIGVKNLLIEEGYDPSAIERIHMPIGLAIGALTPAEIAVSILAELIQVKRNRKQDFEPADADFSVLEKLSVEGEPHSIVTVLETRGSTPRRPGAKMIVYPEGRIVGSIGGGCAEAEVMREALHYIGTGKCGKITVDMTKDVSEEDVMVCGGTMTVLIEG
ncbi:XdhC/CoxI family protein [Frisingicoccus sp.]|uniref:XdhC/CoxI family protein n=1 Tax=Frisingicoccus sp. TaxID=1918627 RepID=UPI002A7F3887|nr:XdhC/CoxI family protein [Frisingicoccus sp.]MDY4922492.1 XdhC/CoxI family protein [Frisingicoccus sp.]